ncbi:hypothetical protein L9F63_005129, partial [Diploptera punctata]
SIVKNSQDLLRQNYKNYSLDKTVRNQVLKKLPLCENHLEQRVKAVRSYSTLMKKENMSTNTSGDGNDSDDFM